MFIKTTGIALLIIGLLSYFDNKVQAIDYVVADWHLPTDSTDEETLRYYDDGISVVVGDTITFEWDEGSLHNVYIHPHNGCDMHVDRIKVGTESPATYTFVMDDAHHRGQKMLFACDIGKHCERGQNIEIRVYDTQSNLNEREGISGNNPNNEEGGSTNNGNVVVDDNDDNNKSKASTNSRSVVGINYLLLYFTTTSIVVLLLVR